MARPTKVGQLKDHPGMPKEVPDLGPDDITKHRLHRGDSEFGPMDNTHCSVGWAYVIFSKSKTPERNAFASLFIKGLACSILKDSKARERVKYSDLSELDRKANEGPDGLSAEDARGIVINHNDSPMTTHKDIADLLNNGLASLGYDKPSSTLLKSNR